MKETLIVKASFNEKVRIYLFFIGMFYLIATVIGILLVPFWVLGIGQWLSGLFFKSLSCELTNKNLKFSRGIIFHVQKTIPLENIQDLSFIGGPVLRAFGLTQLKVETAGGGGSAHNQNIMNIIGLNDAEQIKTQILEERERVMRSMRGTDSSQQVNTNQATAEVFGQILAELKEIKEVLKSK